MMRHFSCGEDKFTKEKDPCRKSVCISDTCWIERPKFFHGQLLTDADLKAGQNYVIEKNKLHNRYLHGWGVVCGLKVKCYPCCEGHGSSGKVLVEPGYAIDCCGNDIIVCEEQEYDVVKKINELKKKKKAESDPCAPGTVEEPECPEKEEKYYLTLSYKEEDAKPATALRADDPCSIQRCVPSRTKECFELDLVKFCTLEPTPDENFFTRALKCLTIFTETWKRVTDNKEFTGDNFKDLTTDELKRLIREYYKALPANVHCDVLDQLEEFEPSTSPEADWITIITNQACNDLELPDFETTVEKVPGLMGWFDGQGYPLSPSATISKKADIDEWEIHDEDNGRSYLLQRFCSEISVSCICSVKMREEAGGGRPDYLLVRLLLDCICQALLIPCPTCNEDDVVILATITVKNNKIDKICNLARKYVLTSHSLKYWITPFINFLLKGFFAEVSKKRGVKIDSIHDWLEFFCCVLDISQTGSLPPYVYFLKLLENDFEIPKMMERNFSESMSAISKSFMDTLDPQNVSLNSALNKKPDESADILKKLKIEVVGTERYDPSERGLSLADIFRTMPLARPGSKVIQLVDDNNNVVGFRAVKVKEKAKEEPPGAPEDVKVLKKLMADMSKKMAAMEKQLEEIKKKPEETKTTRTKKK